MYRYRIARAMGKRELEAVIGEDADLLQQFGARLLSVQGGVRAALESELRDDGRIHPWNTITIDEKTWEWLRPLLVQLSCLQATTKIAAN